MPVHGEYRHLKHHCDLAESLGMDKKNTFILQSGEVLELTEDSCRKEGKVRSGGVYVDGLGVGDVGTIVLRDRRHLAQDGMLTIVVAIDSESLSIVSGPDIITRGFVYVKESEELINSVKNIAEVEVDKCLSVGTIEWYVIKGNIKRAVKNYIYEKNGVFDNLDVAYYQEVDTFYKLKHGTENERALYDRLVKLITTRQKEHYNQE